MKKPVIYTRKKRFGAARFKPIIHLTKTLTEYFITNRNAIKYASGRYICHSNDLVTMAIIIVMDIGYL